MVHARGLGRLLQVRLRDVLRRASDHPVRHLGVLALAPRRAHARPWRSPGLGQACSSATAHHHCLLHPARHPQARLLRYRLLRPTRLHQAHHLLRRCRHTSASQPTSMYGVQHPGCMPAHTRRSNSSVRRHQLLPSWPTKCVASIEIQRFSEQRMQRLLSAARRRRERGCIITSWAPSNVQHVIFEGLADAVITCCGAGGGRWKRV